MARNPMQDIVPKGRSIRNIPVPPTRTKAAIRKEEKKIADQEKELKKDIAMKEEAESRLREDIEEEKIVLEEGEAQKEELRRVKEEFESSRVRRGKNTARNRKAFYWVVGIIAAVVIVYLLGGIFKSATVTVTPRVLAFTANADLTAKKVAGAGELPFQVITSSSSSSETVKAAGQKQVTTRATGTIVIYNNYSATPQRLIKNTRFSTPEGLIFRIADSVTVPGKKGTTPGSIDAVVIADEAGANYNVGLKDFTIPGFKGDPRYTTFYARSKTPLAGGFSGIQKVVADADRAKAKASIEAKIAGDLLRQAQSQKTAEQVLFDKAYTIDYTTLPDEASGDQVTIKEQGTISAVAFDKKQLSASLAKIYIQSYKGDAITIPSIDGLAFTASALRPSADSISFHLAGNAAFEWLYDASALKTALKGQSRSATPTILQKFPMIEKADISISPFWARSFPGSVNSITVKKSV